MSSNGLIESIREFLNTTNFSFNTEKKSLQELLVKLKSKRLLVLKELQKDLEPIHKEKLEEELTLLSFHITKAKEKFNSF